MKKMIFCAVVLFLVLTAAVFANRNEIEEVIKAYEAVVVEAEQVAQKPLVAAGDFASLEAKAEAAGPKIQAIENEKEWAIQDAKRLADLNARFNRAMTTIAKILIKY